MLVIRMQRTGRKGHAMFRVVVQDSRQTPTSGKLVAHLGNYDPHSKTVSLDKEKATFYLEHGAQPSDRATLLLKGEGVKLPNWVQEPAKKKRTVRNPEKRRSTAPEKPAGEQEKPAEEAEKPTEEAPGPEQPVEEAAEAEAPAAEPAKPSDDKPADDANSGNADDATSDDDKSEDSGQTEEEPAPAPEKPAEETAKSNEPKDEPEDTGDKPKDTVEAKS